MSVQAIGAAIEFSVRTLLEAKHLYQSIDVDAEGAFLSTQKTTTLHQMLNVSQTENWPWIVKDAGSLDAAFSMFNTKNDSRIVAWNQPDVKLFCKKCNRIEPYNGVSATNVLNRLDASKGGILDSGKLIQVFCLTYLCQSCKAVPEVFLIRRSANRLTLSGRAPIEHVETPKSIPKEIITYFSGAKIAHHSGQTLAAIFLLRTLCEQWARKFSNSEDFADIALDRYMQSLPDDFKARFPSLRTVYSDLSVAIHSALASSEIFDSAAQRIEEHFDARKLYKLKSP